MKRLNHYFFGQPEIHFLDALYFYGTNLSIMVIIILVSIVKL